jgi:hypothetical protein
VVPKKSRRGLYQERGSSNADVRRALEVGTGERKGNLDTEAKLESSKSLSPALILGSVQLLWSSRSNSPIILSVLSCPLTRARKEPKLWQKAVLQR